jgi:signal transduction histidine kinase
MLISLRARLWFTYALLSGIILCAVGTGLLLYLLRNPPSTAREYQRLQFFAAAFTRRPSLLGSGSLVDAAPALERIDSAFDVRILILAPDGALLVDTRSGKNPAIPKLINQAVRNGSIDKSPNKKRLIDSQGQVWLYVSRRIEGNQVMIVASPRPKVPLKDILREELLPPLFQAGLGAAALAILLAIWMAHWVTSPLQRITKSAQALAAGKHEPIPVEGPEEVRELARAFNEMSARVQATQQSQKNFVANVSHDLKTPLTSIQGFSQAILDGTASTPDELSKAAEVIYSESSRMNRMVLDLLELARLDAGLGEFKHQPVDLAALLKDLEGKFSLQAQQAQINLRAEIGPMPPLNGDGDRLVQAFTNLVDNAVKFTPANGAVVIRAGHAAGMVEVSVSDTGSGILPADIPHIFDRFYQTDKSRSREHRGSGLGLSIAKEIIEAHHGTITVHSQPDHGSTFVVTLPVSINE